MISNSINERRFKRGRISRAQVNDTTSDGSAHMADQHAGSAGVLLERSSPPVDSKSSQSDDTAPDAMISPALDSTAERPPSSGSGQRAKPTANLPEIPLGTSAASTPPTLAVCGNSEVASSSRRGRQPRTTSLQSEPTDADIEALQKVLAPGKTAIIEAGNIVVLMVETFHERREIRKQKRVERAEELCAVSFQSGAVDVGTLGKLYTAVITR